MKSYHEIKNLRLSGEYITLNIDGEEKKFKIKDISPRLDKASETERNTFEVSSSGYGIHWPLIDEDIAIDGLLGIVHAKELQRKSALPVLHCQPITLSFLVTFHAFLDFP